MNADLALATGPKERIAALERHWYTVRTLEEWEAMRAKAEIRWPETLLQVTFARLEAEIEIVKEKAKTGK